MAGATEFFGLCFFDFGDELDAPLNVRKEIDRFVTIDRQLYGMFNIFGNGVISGWQIISGIELQINISPGVAILQSFAVETEFSDTIQDLPPNTTGYVYAQINSNTIVDRTVEFIYSISPLVVNALLIAKVVTGPAAIQTIDNTVRTQIGFKKIIADAIAAHRHNGADSPKIDLTQEVQGELPMDRLADIDAAKIKGGKLPTNVLGIIDHTTMRNIGRVPHAGLDSFVQSIQKDNVRLLGEVTTINLLKMLCYMKYLDSTCDRFFENQLVIIPGISVDDHIDWDATNANVNLKTHCISGLPTFPSDLAVIGDQANAAGENLQVVTIPWVTDADFRLASSISNIAISNGVKLSVNSIDARIVETFDTGVIGQPIDTYVSTLVETNTTSATYDQPSAQGALAGKFSTINSRKMKQVRTFPRSQDWSTYDTLNIYVKSGSSAHAAVTVLIKDVTGAELGTFLLLSADEVTTLSNDSTNGFALKQLPISGFERFNVGSIEFHTDAISNDSEAYYVDTVYLTSQNFLLPQGNIRLRYSTTSSVIFNSIEFYGDFPTGTDTRIRVRVGNTIDDLSAATYTSLLNSGEAFALPGTYIEIDITLLSDFTRRKTPLLTALYLSLLVPSKEAGLTINSAESWHKGVAENVAISTDGVVSMNRKNVGDFYFIEGNMATELDLDLLPVAGVGADNMPIAPYQGYAAINSSAQIPNPNKPTREFLRGLYIPKSVFRLKSGNFLIADTGNDRILEMTQEGDFVRGFGSNNSKYDDILYALTANYNPRLGVLFITFSRDLDIKFVDLRTIILRIGGRDIQLSNAVDKVRNPTTGEIITRPELQTFLDGSSGNFSGQTDNVLSVILSPDKQTFLKGATTDTVSVRVIGNPSPGTNVQVPQNAPFGLECFVGDFMYFGRGGIWRPICARESEDDRYVVANARINFDSDKIAPTGVASIIEFEKAIGSAFDGQKLGTTFSYSNFQFSDIMLGNITYFKTTGTEGDSERKLLIAGLDVAMQIQGSSSSSSAGSLLGSTDATKLSGFIGKVIILDMNSSLISFVYQSPDGLFPSDAYFDDEGNIHVAESGLLPQSGRIVTLDTVGTVIGLVGGGMYTKIWDIRNLPSGHTFVST